MQVVEVIKTDRGRVTIQVNSFGYPEVKVRIGDTTHKINCAYEDVANIKKVVYSLIESKAARV